MSKSVAIAIISDGKDKFLMGKRNDNGKWSCPGGHIEDNETALQGLCREVKEETGLEVVKADLIKIYFEDKITGYVFKCEVKGTIDPSNDPDKESDLWEYKDVWLTKDQLSVKWKDNWLAKYWANC